MAENVVYILGAGFSAPLGLPVTSDFLSVSRNLYDSDREGLNFFQGIYDEIRRLHYVKSFFESNLHNIEEIMSLLEMEASLKGNNKRKNFVRFVTEVIQRTTPVMGPPELPGNWHDYVFGKKAIVREYGSFVGNLLHLSVNRHRDKSLHCFAHNDDETRYSVVTLNYDLVLENYCTYLSDNFNSTLAFSDQMPDAGPGTLLAKLHGCIATGDIIPPTWNKSLHHKILERWQDAYKAISRAHHIRFLGYSLPEADSYVKYLFKASILENEHLKTIDVICRDSRGGVKDRYDEFIDGFPDYQFKSGDLAVYMDRVQQQVPGVRDEVVRFSGLETAHKKFMRE